MQNCPRDVQHTFLMIFFNRHRSMLFFRQCWFQIFLTDFDWGYFLVNLDWKTLLTDVIQKKLVDVSHNIATIENRSKHPSQFQLKNSLNRCQLKNPNRCWQNNNHGQCLPKIIVGRHWPKNPSRCQLKNSLN